MAISMLENEQLFTVPEDVFQVPVRALPLNVMGIGIYLVYVTPDVAKLWLENKNKNRGIKLFVLERLKRSLQNGRWEINGETIIFDPYGRLIEGQHRLQAVVETGTSIWSLIVHGIDQERFKTMGQASKRSVGDILGIRGEKNARNLAAALRWIWRYNTKQMLMTSPLINDDELADTLNEHPDLPLSLAYGPQMHGMAAPGLITAMHYLCSRLDKGLANHFYWSLGSGANLEEGDPILVLRNLLNRHSNRNRFLDEYKAASIILTWNIKRLEPDALLTSVKRITWYKGKRQAYPSIQ